MLWGRGVTGHAHGRWSSFSDLYAATGESPESITWLANRGQYVQHYRIQWVSKTQGRRLLEAPKKQLKRVQRVILRDVLEHASVHAAAMAFRKGRGMVDHAHMHAGRRWVVSMDLQNFFPTITSRRVAGIYRRLGHSDELARVLTDLTTNAARPPEPSSRDERMLYQRRHLPQGAPTSPALANLVASFLDRRLEALAHRIGGAYSRYADDLVISCDHHVPWLVPTIGAIAMREHFSVRFRKTRVMSSAGRQMVTGVVVNERPGVQRIVRKNLEATLVNCVRHGPASQDRECLGNRFRDHLRGRIAYVSQVDPRRAARLVTLFEQIRWPIAS
jgi:RNA-directed DNA polymerase